MSIDVSQECVAKFDCGAGEIYVRSVLPSGTDDAKETNKGLFDVADDTLLPPMSDMFVSVKSSHVSTGNSSMVLVESEPHQSIKTV